MGIPAGAKTYRLFAEFDAVPGADLHLIGLWGDAAAPWFIDAPGGLFVADFAVSDEDVLPKQSLIDPLWFSIFPEMEFSSFWTTGDMWEDVLGSVNAIHLNFFSKGKCWPLRRVSGRQRTKEARACSQWVARCGMSATRSTGCI